MPQRRDTARSSPRHGFADKNRGERLQRVMADAGVASRRDCEALILAGKVRVNGEVVDSLPAWADPASDRIVVAGKHIGSFAPESSGGRAGAARRHVYVMLNKPDNTLTAERDEPGLDRRVVTDLVNHPASGRLFPVGRLDFHTTGLLLLTTDGDLAHLLTHPRFGVAKTYRVDVKGLLEDEQILKMGRGVCVVDRDEGQAVGASHKQPVLVRVVSRSRDRTSVEVTLFEERNRQIRRMLEAVGARVKRSASSSLRSRSAAAAHRTQPSASSTQRGVARGSWRELTAHEVRALRQSVKAGKAEGPHAAPAKKPRVRREAARPQSRTTRSAPRGRA